MIKAGKNLDQEVCPPCCLSIQSLRMPLKNLIRTSKQQIYLRVSTSNHLLPLSSGTNQANLVMRTNTRAEYRLAKICISPKSSGLLWSRLLFQFLKNWNIRQDRIFSTLNFATTFAQTSSFCHVTFEKCQYSLKHIFKQVKSQFKERCRP